MPVVSLANEASISMGTEKCTRNPAAPNYPRRAQISGAHGRVEVWFKTNTNGVIYDIGIKNSSGFEVLDILTLNHVLDNLKCISDTSGNISFNFSLEDTPKKQHTPYEQTQLNINAQSWTNEWKQKNLDSELLSLRSELRELLVTRREIISGKVGDVFAGFGYETINRRDVNSTAEEKSRLQKLINEVKREISVHDNRFQEQNTILSAESIGIQLIGFKQNCSISLPVLNNYGNIDYHKCIRKDDFFTVKLNVRNNLKKSVKDYTISCAAIAQSGTILSRFDNKVFSILEPSVISNVSVHVPATPQAHTMKCKVSSWVNM